MSNDRRLNWRRYDPVPRKPVVDLVWAETEPIRAVGQQVIERSIARCDSRVKFIPKRKGASR